jgi:hypothetical protein
VIVVFMGYSSFRGKGEPQTLLRPLNPKLD